MSAPCRGACKNMGSAKDAFARGLGYCVSCMCFVRPETREGSERPLCPCCGYQVRLKARWRKNRRLPRARPLNTVQRKGRRGGKKGQGPRARG